MTSILKILTVAALVLVALTVLVACNGAAVLNGITPSSSFEREKNIPYGQLPRQTLDIYRAEERKAAAPVVVFVHGGGWNDGSKDLYKFIGDAFAKDGYDVVVPNYRLYPEASYDTLMEDMAGVVSWTADAFVDRSLVLMGHSAGGYNVLQAVFAPGVLAEECRIAGVISLAGPTGAYELKKEPYITVFPDRFRGRDAPLPLAREGVVDVPPLLLVNGTDDNTVGPQNALQLGEAMGETATVKIYPGRGHIDVVRLLSRHFDGDETLKGDIVAFIDELPVPPACG